MRTSTVSAIRRPFMSSLRRAAILLLGGAAALCALPVAPAKAQLAGNDELKAAFIYSFVRYSEWPESPAEIRIAFFGPHPLYRRLTGIISARAPEAQPRYLLCDEEECLHGAHAVFVGRDDPLAHRLAQVTHLKVLTISDIPGFLEAGGIVEIHRRNDRFMFRVSLKNAMQQGIHISPEMLDYADEVLR